MRSLALPPVVFRTVVVLIAVNAIAGIAIIVAINSEELAGQQTRILQTTALVSLATLISLPCFLAQRAGRPEAFTLLPSFAVSCLLIATALAIYVVWADPVSDNPARVAWSFGTAGAAQAHVCLLSLARLRRFYAVLQLLAMLLTMALGVVILGALWAAFDDGFTSRVLRIITGLAILTALTSLLLPAVTRLLSHGQGAVAQPRAQYCPNCSAVLHMDELRCLACGARFRIEFL